MWQDLRRDKVNLILGKWNSGTKRLDWICCDWSEWWSFIFIWKNLIIFHQALNNWRFSSHPTIPRSKIPGLPGDVKCWPSQPTLHTIEIQEWIHRESTFLKKTWRTLAVVAYTYVYIYMYIYIYIYGTPPPKTYIFSFCTGIYSVFFAFLRTFFFRHFLMILEVVFINVYKHRGSWIQDPRFWEKLLGSKVWIQDPRSKILGKTSWIQGLDPRSKIQDSRKNSWIQGLDPRSKIPEKSFPRSEARFHCGSTKFFLESWILDLGSRPWIQEVFPRILDLGSWIQTLDPRSSFWNLGSWIQIKCYGSIVFINVYKRLETCQNPPDRKTDSGKAQSIGKSRLILIHPMSELRIFWANSHIHSPESIFRISVTFL